MIVLINLVESWITQSLKYGDLYYNIYTYNRDYSWYVFQIGIWLTSLHKKSEKNLIL